MESGSGLKIALYFVIMKDEKFGNFIADAENRCLSKSNKIRAEKELGIKLEVAENGIMTKEDYHSAAYAIWIALNFLAGMKGGEKPLEVMEKRVPTLERFLKRLGVVPSHKSPRLLQPPPPSRNRRASASFGFFYKSCPTNK